MISAFQMSNKLEAVDAMVLKLKSEVEGELAPAVLSRFEICVAEALSNLVSHAETRDRDEPNDIVLSKDATSVSVEIFDPVGSPPFDIRDHAVDLSDVEVGAENGRGLGLILECADHVSYGPIENRHRLTLNFQKEQQNQIGGDQK